MRSESQRATREWAYEEFGHAELGDSRRTDRVVRMAAAPAEQPGGKVLDVFRSSAERQAAYDLLSNSRVSQDAMLAATETRQFADVHPRHGFMSSSTVCTARTRVLDVKRRREQIRVRGRTVNPQQASHARPPPAGP
jgi:Transposase DNA-binding